MEVISDKKLVLFIDKFGRKMCKKANLTAAFVLRDRFMDSESEDSVLDLNYSDVNPD